MNKKYYVKGNIIVKTPFFSYLNAGAGFETMPEGCEILSETDLEIDDDHPQSFFAEYYAQKDFVEGYIHSGLFWCNFDVYERLHAFASHFVVDPVHNVL